MHGTTEKRIPYISGDIRNKPTQRGLRLDLRLSEKALPPLREVLAKADELKVVIGENADLHGRKASESQ